jgi:hypothetical protein
VKKRQGDEEQRRGARQRHTEKCRHSQKPS